MLKKSYRLYCEVKFSLIKSNHRSDAQRSVKQKEHKNRELERQIYSADHFDDGGFAPVSMVAIQLSSSPNSISPISPSPQCCTCYPLLTCLPFVCLHTNWSINVQNSVLFLSPSLPLPHTTTLDYECHVYALALQRNCRL